MLNSHNAFGKRVTLGHNKTCYRVFEQMTIFVKKQLSPTNKTKTCQLALHLEKTIGL